MGGFSHNVSTLKPVSRTKAVVLKMKFGLYRRFSRLLNSIGNALHGVPGMMARRHIFYRIDHSLFGYSFIPFVCVFNGQSFLQTSVGDEDECRKLLVDLGVRSTLDVEAVYEIGDGSYITAWWYYDGGSDGEEEYEQYESKLNAYFARRA